MAPRSNLAGLGLDLADLSGFKSRIPPRMTFKRCKLCPTPLNMYNKSKYCHAHSIAGAMAEQAVLEGKEKVLAVKHKVKAKALRDRDKYNKEYYKVNRKSILARIYTSRRKL